MSYKYVVVSVVVVSVVLSYSDLSCVLSGPCSFLLRVGYEWV